MSLINGLSINNWMNVLIECEDNNTISTICKKNLMTYSHVSTIMRELKVKRYVTIKKDGREQIIILTEKGEKTIKNIKAIRESLK